MLQKKFRMKNNTQFDYIFKKGQILKNSKLLIFYSKNKSKFSKFGIVVSKKIGNSVTRNRVKRLIRECIKSSINNFNMHYNYIFVARQGIEALNFHQINEVLIKLIKNSDLYV